ncbi:MAG: hypothetical protein FJY79_07850 [Candidatus Aminicenantes bacterium]|nr:hypothetical protein [Candidatus Aminicenantes bacterium]
MTPVPGDGLTRTTAVSLHAIKEGTLVAGKYRVGGEVGRGGIRVVYRAEDLKLKRPVALKFLSPHLMDAPELKERFLIEAQAAAARAALEVQPEVGIAPSAYEDVLCEKDLRDEHLELVKRQIGGGAAQPEFP